MVVHHHGAVLPGAALRRGRAKGGETLKLISPHAAAQSYRIVGNPFSGSFQFQPLYARIVKEQPDLLE